MEKNIRKRVCWLTVVLSAGLVVFLNILSYFGLCS